MIGRTRFGQVLVGSYRLATDPRLEHPLSVRLDGTKAALLPGVSAPIEVEGEIDARGLADSKALSGRVRLDPWRPFAAHYELDFSSNDGAAMVLRASKKLTLRDPLWSSSTVRGEIFDDRGRAVARLELRIDYRRELRKWVLG